MPRSKDTDSPNETIAERIMSSFRYRPEILEGVPEHLTRHLKQFEDWFLLEAAELKKITKHFVKELEKGLTIEGGNIVGNPFTIP
jgi:hexokinase